MLLTQIYCHYALRFPNMPCMKRVHKDKKASAHPYLANKVDLCVRGHELPTVYWLAAHERA